MTLKELLDEQEEKLNGILGEVPEVLEQFKGMTCPICGQSSDKSPQMQELKDFLRQSGIETVKWVVVELKQGYTLYHSNFSEGIKEIIRENIVLR